MASTSIWILRHAKATPRDRGGPKDFDRQLLDIGRERAFELGKHVTTATKEPAFEPFPQMVVCSSARRTTETLQCFLDGAKKSPEVVYVRSIYDDDESEILSVLHREAQGHTSVMVVGHNPTVAYLREWLLDPSEQQMRETPTSSLAIISFDVVDVSMVRSGTGHLACFIGRLS